MIIKQSYKHLNNIPLISFKYNRFYAALYSSLNHYYFNPPPATLFFNYTAGNVYRFRFIDKLHLILRGISLIQDRVLFKHYLKMLQKNLTQKRIRV